MNSSSVKSLLLGILLVLFGGFILVDPSSDLGGVTVIIMIAGLVFGIVGFFSKD